MRRRSSRTPSARTRTKNKVAVRLPHRFAHATRRQCRFHIFRAAAAGRLAGCAGSTCCRAKQEMLAVYSPTLPSINWTRQGLSVYPGAAGRGCEKQGVVIAERLLYCFFTYAANHMKRVQRGRSAASTFDSLAQVWGAAAVRLPHFAPAYSPRKALQSQCVHAKMYLRRAADSVPRVSPSSRSPSGSP